MRHLQEDNIQMQNSFQVARDLFALLPVRYVIVHVKSGEKSVLEAKFDKPVMQGIDFSVTEYSYRNLLRRMDKICHPDKPHCTVTSCECGLYRNSMLCKRLVGRTGILLITVSPV